MLNKGEIFNRLKIIRYLPIDEREGKYLDAGNVYECECRCGNKVIAQECDIVSGHTKSCGCLKNEFLSRYSKSGEREKLMRLRGQKPGRPGSVITSESGKSLSIPEWAKEFGISRQALYKKLQTKSIDEIILYYQKEGDKKCL